MSVESQGTDASGELQNQVGDQGEGNSSDNVSYDSYQRAVHNEKKWKQKARDLESKYEQLEEQLQGLQFKQVESTGDKDAVIKTLRDQLAERDSQLAGRDTRYSLLQKKNALQQIAQAEGCTNLEAFTGLVRKDDVQAIDMDQDFNVNLDDVRNVVKAYKDKYRDLNLFKAGRVTVADAPLKTEKQATAIKNIDGMSLEEIKKTIEQISP